MTADELTWTPPGPGQWFTALEHMPTPVTRLFAELFEQVAVGLARGAERYGLPPNHGTFGAVNCLVLLLARRARGAGRRRARPAGRRDARHPALGAGPDPLARGAAPGHRRRQPGPPGRGPARAVRRRAGRPRRPGDRALPRARPAALRGGARRRRGRGAPAGGEGMGPRPPGACSPRWRARRTRRPPPSGCSTASPPGCATREPTDPQDLDDVRAVGGDAAAALARAARGLRLADLRQRPHRADARRAPRGDRPRDPGRPRRSLTALAAQTTEALAPIRAQVPEDERPRFDELVAERARRLRRQRRQHHGALRHAARAGAPRGAGGRPPPGRAGSPRRPPTTRSTPSAPSWRPCSPEAAPAPRSCAARAAARIRARDVAPPPMIGTPVPSPPRPSSAPTPRRSTRCCSAFRSVAWRKGDDPQRANATVGEHVVRGRAVVPVDPTDALLRLEPGDVLVAVTTTASYNTIFPVAGAVAVQHGGAHEPRRGPGPRARSHRGDRRPRPVRSGARRRSGRGRPDRRHDHRAGSSHLTATPA